MEWDCNRVFMEIDDYVWCSNLKHQFQWELALMVAKVWHPGDAIISVMAFQITSVSIVYSTVCSGADQRKHQSSTSLAFVREIHRWPVFPFVDEIILTMSHVPYQIPHKIFIQTYYLYVHDTISSTSDIYIRLICLTRFMLALYL